MPSKQDINLSPQISGSTPRRPNLRALDWLNFFLADVQTGVGPFLAASLTAKGWNPGQVGMFLTFGGIFGIFLQTPAGAVVDAARRKRLLVLAGIIAIVTASLLLAFGSSLHSIILAQVVLGAIGPVMGPAVTAITLGLVGKALFDARLGRNHSFDSAGNVCAALLMGWIGWRFGMKAIFLIVPLLAIPAVLVLAAIPGHEIDYLRSRGARSETEVGSISKVRFLLKDRALAAFAIASFLFHFANAAMLPQLSELLTRGRAREAAPFMSAAVTVTQMVITLTASIVGRWSSKWGPRPLLLIGFAALPIRSVLYTLTTSVPLLIAIQILDGLANSIFSVASAVFVADRTRGTGHFNLAMGGFGTIVGIGPVLSNLVGGAIAQAAGFRMSFLALAGIAAVAFLTLLLFVPDSRVRAPVDSQLRNPLQKPLLAEPPTGSNHQQL
jgi:MFS family permease